MKMLFFLIAVCPAVLAAGTVCRKERDSWKDFLLRAAGWFYGITFINMMFLYVRGWGTFDFNFLTAQFLFKYMFCSAVSAVLCYLAWKEGKTKRFQEKCYELSCLLKKEFAVIQANRAEKHYAVSAGIMVSFTISFLFCVFAPLDLYFNNKGEFWFDFYTLLPLAAALFLAAAFAGTILTVILFRLSKKVYQILWIFGFVLFVCSYIQGNFLAKNLPPLNGTEFDWADYAAGKAESLYLWGTVCILTVLLSNRLPMKKFYSCAKWICGGITSVLALTLCIECAATNGLQEKLDIAVTTKNQLEMSKEGNFVVLVLDTVDTGVFHEELKNHPEYKEVFEDFTYYPDTVGAYPYTSRSIPFMLSGEWFENEEPFEDYIENVYKNSEFLSALSKNGYKTGIYEPLMPLTDRSICRFDNVSEYKVKVSSYLKFAGLELKLTGFKYAPFFLKKYCMVGINDFAALRKADDMPYRPVEFSNRVFYDNVRYGNITYADQKCFRFIHLEGAHPPYLYNKDVEFVPDSTYEQNIGACVTIAGTYLTKLKEAGVYDNSVIFIMADHGYNWDDSYGRQDPLLLIKGAGENHAMKISSAPVSYEDLQTAYKRLMSGEKGEAVFDWKEGDRRERRFLWHQEEDHMVEYVQKGQASDTASMIPTGRVFDR